MIELPRVTRVTLVPMTGAVYEAWNVTVRLDLQDDGRTLKMFVGPPDGTIRKLVDCVYGLIEDDVLCVYCLHSIDVHDNETPGCTTCGCTRVVFDE